MLGIKDLVSQSGLNKTEFAKKYNIPLRTLQKWCAGDRHPPVYVLQMLNKLEDLDRRSKEQIDG